MKPFWKWIIAIVVTLILVLATALWYLGNHWRPLLNEKIHEMALRSSDSLYRVTYDDLDFNLVTGNASLRNFKLIPDTGVYRRLKEQKKAPDNVYKIAVARLEIENFHPKRIYTQRKLNIDRIVIESPIITVLNEHQPYHDTVAIKDKRSLYQKISEILNELTVGHVAFENVQVTYQNRNESVEKITRLKNVNINITDLRIDSTSQHDSLRFYNARNVDFQMDNYRIATGDSLYYLDVQGIHFTSAQRSIVLDGLKMTPRYSKIDFYKKVKQAKDRFDLTFDTIRIQRIDLFKLLRQQKLYAEKVALGQATVAIYNNKSYPSIQETKIGKYPHQQLRKLAIPIKIDTLQLNNMLISYAEYNGKSGQTGKVTFNHTKGNFYHITNDSTALQRNRFLTAALESKFMNQGKLEIQFSFDLLDKLGAFTYRGTLSQMNARALNPVTKPLAMLEISSGYFSKLGFQVKANEYRADGRVDFYYKKLAVGVIVKEKDGSRAKSDVASVLTNKFIINDSNPDANEHFHPGPIHYRRPLTASFFNFLWKSLFEGVKASAGVSKEREAKLMSTAENADKAVGKVKGFFKRVFKKKNDKHIKEEK